MKEGYRTSGPNGRGDPGEGESGEAQRAAAGYIRQGIAPIPVRNGKNPGRPGWQNERLTVEDVAEAFPPGANIGVLLGEPSGGLVDVDLDLPEVVKIAGRFLPPTLTSGRASAPDAHWWYRAPGVAYREFTDLGGDTILEIRSTGHQTLVEPSVHPDTGERITWARSGLKISEADPEELVRVCRELAAAGLIARCLPPIGGRHRFALALAGFLLRRGLVPEVVLRIMHAAWDASGAGFTSEKAKREAHADIEGVVMDTAGKITAGEEASGGRILGEVVAGLPRKLSRYFDFPADPRDVSHGHDRTTRKDPPAQTPAQGEKGLTVELAEAILAEERFAQDAGGRLYRFEHGAYRAGGEKYIARRVKALLGSWGLLSKWSSYRAAEVTKYVGADAPELWERPPLDRINVLNGILVLESRELLEHSPDWLSTVQLPVAYDPGATCPAWEQQVADTFPDDAQALAWEIPADLMQPDRSVQKAIIVIGEGSNGKSVYLENLAVGFLGRHNRSTLSLHRIEADRFAASRLVGKLANICPDLPSQDLAGTSAFKAITGGDEITGERKYADAFDFTPYCRLLFSANHPPRSQDASHAFFRRWLVVPFNRTFEEGEAVPRRELDARLRGPKELSGLLNKALDALPNLRRRGFTESESMREAWEEFRQMTDPLAVWLDRATVLGPEAWVTKDDLLNAYNKECARDGRPYLTKKAIAQALKRLRPGVVDGQKMVSGKSSTIWKGIGLRSPEPDGGGSGSADRSTVSTVSTVSSNCYEKAGDGGEGKEGATQKNREKPFKPFKPPNTEPSTPRGDRLTPEEAETYKRMRALGHDEDEARRIARGEEEKTSA